MTTEINSAALKAKHGNNTFLISQELYESGWTKEEIEDFLRKEGFPQTTVPFPFQIDGINWLRSFRDNGNGFVCEENVGLIGDEMTLGKTATALNTVRFLLESGLKGLFVVPGATIIQWQKQFDRWVLDNEPDEFGADSLYAVRSTKGIIPQDASCILSHSLIAREAMIEKLANANFDFIVIDEIHKFGASGTKRIKNLWNLINLSESKFAKGRIGLSGTPVRNYAKEIYNIAHFLNPTKFRNREGFGGFEQTYLTYDKKALRQPDKFHQDFKPFMIRRTIKEVLPQMPEIRRTKLYTEITDPFVTKAYNKELDLMSNFMNSAHKVDAFSLLGFLIKLRHITGIAKAKEPAIIEPIKDYLAGENGPETQRKAVFGIHHHFVTQRLRKSIPEYKHYLIRGGMNDFEKEREKIAFIEHKGGAILQLSTKAAGEGIDGLQYSGATKMYVFEPQWNMQDILQLEKRIHRIGQRGMCHIEYTIAVGTVDEFFWDLSEEKQCYTTQVEDCNWISNPAFLRKLAERVISNRLPSIQLGKSYEEDENPLESIKAQPELSHSVLSDEDAELNEILSGKDLEI